MSDRSSRPVWLGEDLRRWDHARIHLSLLRDDRLGAYELAVYLGLAAHADLPSGEAWPAVSTLAGYGVMSENKARDALKVLTEAGYVAVEVRKGKANHYRLLPPPPLHVVRGSKDRTPPPGEGDPSTTCGGTPPRGEGEQKPGNKNHQQQGSPGPAAPDAPRVVVLEEQDELTGRIVLREVPLAWRVPAICPVESLTAAVRLCELMAAHLDERGERVEGKAHSQRWVLDMEALLRIDGRDPERVEVVLRWLHASADDVATFWRTNVRSPAKLRSQWVRMGEQYTAKVKRTSQSRLPLSDDAARIVADQYRGNGSGPRPTTGRSLPSGPGGEAR